MRINGTEYRNLSLEEFKEQFGSKIDLSTISTPDLVRELCSREGVESHGISELYQVSIDHEIECLEPVEVQGPARIIVVRGEE